MDFHMESSGFSHASMHAKPCIQSPMLLCLSSRGPSSPLLSWLQPPNPDMGSGWGSGPGPPHLTSLYAPPAAPSVPWLEIPPALGAFSMPGSDPDLPVPLPPPIRSAGPHQVLRPSDSLPVWSPHSSQDARLESEIKSGHSA